MYIYKQNKNNIIPIKKSLNKITFEDIDGFNAGIGYRQVGVKDTSSVYGAIVDNLSCDKMECIIGESPYQKGIYELNLRLYTDGIIKKNKLINSVRTTHDIITKNILSKTGEIKVIIDDDVVTIKLDDKDRIVTFKSKSTEKYGTLLVPQALVSPEKAGYNMITVKSVVNKETKKTNMVELGLLVYKKDLNKMFDFAEKLGLIISGNPIIR